MQRTDYKEKAVSHWLQTVRETIRSEKAISLQVTSGCMKPIICPQDRVIVRESRLENLKPGDIVLFERDSTLHVHRFLKKCFYDKECFLLSKADTSLLADEPVPEAQLLGKVIRIVKKARAIDLERLQGRVMNRLLHLFLLLKMWSYVLASRLKRCLKRELRSEDLLIRHCSTTDIDEKTMLIIKKILSQHLNWDYFLQQVKKKDTAPLIYKTFLNREGTETRVPAHVQRFLKDSYYSVLASNISLIQTLERIAQDFKSESIDVICYKGAMLAEQVYRDSGLRPMGDIDLLIRKEDIVKADNILRRNGYSMPLEIKGFDGFSPGQYRNSFLYRSENRFSNAVHLHWHVVNFSPYDERIIQKINMDRVWHESIPVRLGNADLRTFSLHHEIIFLCMHALNHAFYPLLRLCDINELLRLRKDDINWDRLVKDSFEFHLSKCVYYVLYLVSTMLKAEMPETVLHRLKPKRISLIESKFISAVLNGKPILTGEWLMCFGMNEGLRDKLSFLRRLIFPPKRELALIRKKSASTIGFFDYQRRLTAGITCAVKVMFHFARQMSSKM